MKGNLPLLCLMLFCSYLGTAQITITSDDYVSPLGDTLVNVNVFNLTLQGAYYAPPTEGANQAWDYRWLELTTRNLDPEPEVSSQAFPIANSIDETSIFADFTPDTPIPINLIERYDDSGKAILGEEVVTTVTAPFACGNCTEADSVRYEPVSNAFEEAEQLLQLPLAFGDSWSSSYTRTTNMQLFLPAFSLNDVPAQQVDDVQVDHEVVGWGTLTLPNLTYSGLQEIEALLVKQTTTETSNYTVDGAPAPPALLDTLGLTNGQVTVTTVYQFFAEGLDQPALTVGFSGDGQVFGYTVAGSIADINPDDEGQFIPQFTQHDGNDRNYFLYIPPGYDGSESIPVVVALHGYTSNASQFAWQSQINAVADTAGFMVVYPQGLIVNNTAPPPGFPPAGPGWNVGQPPLISDLDDIGFIISVLDEVVDNYNVNDAKVYLTGISNGGFMSSVLAAARPDLFAAVAIAAGTVPVPRSALIPSLVIHGTDDMVVPFAGNPAEGIPSVPETVGIFANINGCAFVPDSTDLPDLDPNDGTTVTKFEYTDCDGNADVVFYRVNGGGHVWESTGPVPPIFQPVLGAFVNQDFNASATIWNFFNQYELPNAQLITKKITVDTIEREYTVYVPAAYDGSEAWPVVFNFHEANVPVPIYISTLNTNTVADTANFLVVYPTALDGFIAALDTVSTLWQDGTLVGNLEVDDVSFVNSMIDQLALDYNVDPTRIYTMGSGSGGAASAFFSLQLPNRIAAMANVQGFVNFSPSVPIPGLFMYGTADPFIPETGIPGIIPPFVEGVKSWALSSMCDTIPEETILPDLVSSDSSTVTIFNYPNCSQGIEVLYYRIEGGGRTWPGGGPVPDGGPINFDINADIEIWNFFNRQQLITSTQNVKPSFFQIEVYPNPFSDELNFEFELPQAERVQLALYNPLGQQVARIVNQQLGQGKQRIQWRQPGAALPSGVYYYRLQIGERVVSRPVVVR